MRETFVQQGNQSPDQGTQGSGGSPFDPSGVRDREAHPEAIEQEDPQARIELILRFQAKA